MRFAESVNRFLRRVPAWPIYAAGAALPLWLLWLGIQGGLGVDPVKTIEHTLGLWALKLIVATLAVTPLRRFTGINLVKFRRATGLVAFFYVVSTWGFSGRRRWATSPSAPMLCWGWPGFC